MRPLLWRRGSYPIILFKARVAELVDAADLKSAVRKDVPVRVRPWAPIKTIICRRFQELIYIFPCDLPAWNDSAS
jgi:hypothetical protein